VISSAARDRVKLAVDQLEEAFHRGKAMAFQEAAHYVKSALHDIDVKSL
jgi:hypothetical protein